MQIAYTMVNMHGYVDRELASRLQTDLAQFPAVVVLGPRQAGKSTFVSKLASTWSRAIRLDLERPSDQARISDPELFLTRHRSDLVIIDEVQSTPELFPVLRSEIDADRRPGRFVLLGSASRELVNRSSESLAGRASYLELTPFTPTEVIRCPDDLDRLVVRGGFPESYLADSNSASFRWREVFIRSYLERDLPLLGLSAPVPLVERLFRMTAHLQGQTLNSSHLADSLGVSSGSIRRYLDFMDQALLIRQLPSWQGNLKKRLVKSPKLYIRDTGIAASLLGIHSFTDLLGHPAWGSIWETLVLDACQTWCPSALASYFRTSNGAEVDLVLERGTTRVIVEAKASSAPSLSRGFWSAREDLKPLTSIVCAPVDSAYPIANGVEVVAVTDLRSRLAELGVADETYR